jgi:Protein of unknown function (DUF1579)
MIPIGNWHGTVRTWFEPDSEVIVSDITATTSPVLGGKSVRVDYNSSVQNNRSDGLMIFGTDIHTNKPCLTWIDTFHTGGNVMTFAADDDGSLLGSYAAGDVVWRWRVRFHEGDEWRIEHFNIPADDPEYRAIEVTLRAT